MVGEPPHAVGVAARGEKLEGADADMARRHAGQHRAGQHGLADHVLAGDDGGERARGRNAQREHRLADDVFAQHRPERRAAVAAAGERRGARALELDVAADAVRVDDLAEQDGAAVAELGHEMPELVAGIGHRDRIGAVGNASCRRGFRRPRARQQVGIEAELERQRPVQLDQPGRGHRGRRHAGEKARRQRRIGVLEGEMHRHGLKIGAPELAVRMASSPNNPPIGCRAASPRLNPARVSDRPCRRPIRPIRHPLLRHPCIVTGHILRRAP